MKHYNCGPNDRHRLINTRAFVNGLRLPLEGVREKAVKESFCKIVGDKEAECFTVKQAREAFAYQEFDKWCEAMQLPNSDDEIVTMEQFCEFYADISMTIFKDQEVVSLVSETWCVDTSGYFVHPKEVETLIAAIRHNLMKHGSSRHSEEFILRDCFRELDRNGDGGLGIDELRALLMRINLRTEEKYLKALLDKFDTNQNGKVEFEEFQRYVVADRYHKY